MNVIDLFAGAGGFSTGATVTRDRCAIVDDDRMHMLSRWGCRPVMRFPDTYQLGQPSSRRAPARQRGLPHTGQPHQQGTAARSMRIQRRKHQQP